MYIVRPNDYPIAIFIVYISLARHICYCGISICQCIIFATLECEPFFNVAIFQAYRASNKSSFTNRRHFRIQSLIKGLAAQLTQSGTPNIRLCDCLECHSSTLQENCVSVTGSYPVYGATGLIGYTNNYAYNGESILIVKDGSGVGSLSYVNDHFSVIGTLNYLTAKENYSILYLYYALMAFNFTPYITGMAIPHIYFKDYGKAKLFYPSIEKRIRIASLLHNIEQKVSCGTKPCYITKRTKILPAAYVVYINIMCNRYCFCKFKNLKSSCSIDSFSSIEDVKFVIFFCCAIDGKGHLI